MKHILASVAMASLFTVHAYAQPPETTPAPEAGVAVEGIDPAKVLGAIDPTKLVEGADQSSTVTTAQTPPPANTPLVLPKTTVEETPEAIVERTSETIIPVSNWPAVDDDNPIAPEVQAVVDSKPRYTTADLANAQLATVLATPASEPTTTITTTRTTPKSGG